jgi:uncharacterized membrane protein
MMHMPNHELDSPTRGPLHAPGDILAIDFDDPLLAQEALMAATRLGKRGSVSLGDAVIVSRDRRGKTRIRQTRDISPGRGAATGFWWGGLSGLLIFGTAGWLLGAVLGALAGAAYGKFRDIGINDDWLKRLGDELTPGHTATVLLLPQFYATHLLRELRRFNGRLLHSSLPGIDNADLEEALDTLI